MTYSMENVVVAARRKLLANPNFAALVGTDVGRDTTGAYTDAWVFKSGDEDMQPDRNPRNSGTSAVVLSLTSSWTSPNRHNTLRFPLLFFRIYSDSTRGSDPTLLLQKDAEYRCDRVASVIRDTFNDVSNRDHLWPNNVFIVSSALWTDLRVDYVQGEDGLVIGDITFALEVG